MSHSILPRNVACVCRVLILFSVWIGFASNLILHVTAVAAAATTIERSTSNWPFLLLLLSRLQKIELALEYKWQKKCAHTRYDIQFEVHSNVAMKRAWIVIEFIVLTRLSSVVAHTT